MKEPLPITAMAIFVSLACIVFGFLLVCLFEEMKIRDIKKGRYPKAERPDKKEIDRLLDLDETERMIS